MEENNTQLSLHEQIAAAESEINYRLARLSETDYKVIKLAEAQLTGTAPEYSAAEVVAERQAHRTAINEQQESLATLKAELLDQTFIEL